MIFDLYAAEKPEERGEHVLTLRSCPTYFDLLSNRTPLTAQILMDWKFQEFWNHMVVRRMNAVPEDDKVWYISTIYGEDWLTRRLRPPIRLNLIRSPVLFGRSSG